METLVKNGMEVVDIFVYFFKPSKGVEPKTLPRLEHDPRITHGRH